MSQEDEAMKIPKLKPGDAIEVIWMDANSPKEVVWQTVSDFISDSPKMEIISRGTFITKRKGYIRIAGEISSSDDYADVVNRVFNIPLGTIKKIRRLT